MPLALAIAELEVGPGAKRVELRQQIADEPEALRLVAELRAGHLAPALRSRHLSSSLLASASYSLSDLASSLCTIQITDAWNELLVVVP